jgi:uncharacterized cupin superfamily protein
VGEAEVRAGDEGGLVPQDDGWFVVNLADATVMHTDRFGDGWRLEGKAAFPEFGINVRILQPGQPNALYHREDAQEAFLVLSGECVAIVEDEERPMRKGDFLHAPAGVAHTFVGAGEGPCAILMVGARRPGVEFQFPVSAVAGGYGASVEQEIETDTPRVAYAGTMSAPPERTRRALPW